MAGREVGERGQGKRGHGVFNGDAERENSVRADLLRADARTHPANTPARKNRSPNLLCPPV
jgi:hypothetical protein